ncbi:probable glutamate receptor [Eriocheir sinensis]|uniref:probable glutamate receptor n=1 Tax=Eriocheir sinensis TaxID=95602 RepID=UPI0021C6B2BC|nr:probable glutamate receptor [Eriocheir sinensis]
MICLARILLFILLSSEVAWTGSEIRPSPGSDWFHRTAGALEVVLSKTTNTDVTLITFVDRRLSHYYNIEQMLQRSVSRGVGVFQAAVDGQKGNSTLTHFERTIEEVRKLRVMSLSVIMVVVSGDPVFLQAFADLSLKGRLQMWSTKLILYTNMPLHLLQGLHKLLSTRNCMLFLANELAQVNVYVQPPYSEVDALPLLVAKWGKGWGLTLLSRLTLFPEKYLRFSTAPKLVVTIELLPHHVIYWKEDPTVPEGKRLAFTGTMDKTVRYFSKAMNFTYTYVRSPEETFGTRLPDGYWTGMMGMVVREEADFGTGPFILNEARASAADFTSTIWMDNMRIVSGRGSPEVDPWGFLFPLRPMVWMALIAALFVIMVVIKFLAVFNLNIPATTNAFSMVRVLLQQDEHTGNKTWSWERLVLGLWMLTMLVLTKSYAGNLMSLLAVKYVPQPFQTLRDVLDDSKIISIWQRYSSNEQFLREVDSGIYHEVAELEKESRLMFRTQGEFPESLRTLVRPGHHILIDAGVTVRNLIAQQFSMTGQCDFFRSKEGFLPFSAVVTTQRNNPLMNGLDKRVMELMESGLFRYWFRTGIPNSSYCDNPPRRFLETTALAATNLWGMFVVLAGGLATSLLALVVEILADSGRPMN